MKKAQITMESLLLYGAAILVVLLAIAALTYFGVFNLGNLFPQSCDLSGTGLIKCDEYQITKSDETIVVVIRNTASRPITIDETNSKFTAEALVTDCVGTDAEPETVLPGKTSKLTITCDTIASDVGDRLKGTLSVDSVYADGGTLHTLTQGTLSARVG
jgi:hypothetical protein